MCIKDNRPFSALTTEGFRSMITCIDDGMSPPCLATCNDILKLIFDDIKGRLKVDLDTARNEIGVEFINISDDVWPAHGAKFSMGAICATFNRVVLSGTDSPLLAAAASAPASAPARKIEHVDIALAVVPLESERHAAANLLEFHETVFTSYGISHEDVASAYPDGNSANKAAQNLYVEKYPTSKVDQGICTGHDFARCVVTANGTGTTPSQNPLLSSVISLHRRISARYHSSVKSAHLLRETQIDLGVKEPRVTVQGVETRWGSDFKALRRNNELQCCLVGSDWGLWGGEVRGLVVGFVLRATLDCESVGESGEGPTSPHH